MRAGEVLVVDLARPKVAKLKPFECKLDILHEDDQMVVINKPAGMVVHPGDGTDDNTSARFIASALRNYVLSVHLIGQG